MIDKSYSYYGIGSWDMDYPDCYHEEYICRKCNIIYRNSQWIVPSSLRASYKQIKCAEVIGRVLRIPVPTCPIKSHLWKFIHDNKYRSLLEAKHQRDNSLRDWCEDNQDWLPEYF